MSETLTVNSYSGGAVTLAVKSTRGDGWLDRVVTTCPGCFAHRGAMSARAAGQGVRHVEG